MASGPVCAMVWEGKEVVKTGRALLGATNPLASQPGTIRGDFAIVSFYLRRIRCLTVADDSTSRMSDAMSAMAPTVSSQRRRRSRCGSMRRILPAGRCSSTIGSTRNSGMNCEDCFGVRLHLHCTNDEALKA